MNKFLSKMIEPTTGRDIPLNDRLAARMILVSAMAGFFGTFICLLCHTHFLAVIITAFFAVAIPICMCSL